MEWPYEIAERDHDIQNPTSPEKIRLLGEYLRRDNTTRVIDIACGKAGPAIVLAATFGCRVVGVELRPGFAAEARKRIEANDLGSLIEIRTGDASDLSLEPEAWDVALCLGASFVWGQISDAAAVLVPAVRPGGFVAIGEPFWRTWPLPAGIDDENFVGLADTVERFEAPGLTVTGLVAASPDDWARYESLHWRAMDEWLAERTGEPSTESLRARDKQFRDHYFRFKRALLGWAIFVGRKR